MEGDVEVSRSRRGSGGESRCRLIVLGRDESYLSTRANGESSCRSRSRDDCSRLPLKRDFEEAPTARKHSSALSLQGVFASRAEPPGGTVRPIHHTLCRVTPLAVLALLP